MSIKRKMKFTILARLLLGNAVITLLIIFMGSYVFTKLNDLNRIMRDIALVDVSTVRNLELMLTLLLSQKEFEKKYLVLKDEDFYEQFKKTSKRFSEVMQEVEPMLDLSEESELFAGMREDYTRYLVLFNEKVALMKTGKEGSDQSHVSERDLLAERIDRKLKKIIIIERKDRDSKIALSQIISDHVLRVFTVTAGLTIVVGLLVSFFSTRGINRSIKLLKRKTKEIALERFIEIHDIRSPPEIKELADDFNVMSRRLRELDEIKTDFISNVSHELRTPLTAIREASEMLLQKTFADLSDKQESLLTIIRDECERLIAAVNKILDLSRLESGVMDCRSEPCNIQPLLQKTVLKLAPIAQNKKIDLELKPLPALPMVRIDEEKIAYVLMNLLGNALKYTPVKGAVAVRAFLSKKRRGFISISVSDTGPGIRKQDHDRIFDRFARVSHVDEKADGTGLGLSIAKQIILEHGGKIWVESEPGKGSVFYFTLPVS